MPNHNKPLAGFNSNPENINRNGRPKAEWTIAGLIREALERTDKEGITDKQYVYQKLVDLAKNGDVAALKEINNRLEGQAVAKQEVEIKKSLLLDDDSKIQSADEPPAKATGSPKTTI